MWHRKGQAVLAAWALLAVVGLSSSTRASDPEPADVTGWVANDAVIFVEVSKAGDLVDRLRDERVLGPLKSVPNVRAALEGEQYRKLIEISEKLSQKLGMPWDQALKTLTGGGVVMAVEATEGQEPHAFLVATPTDKDLVPKAVDALIELARAEAADRGEPDAIKSAEYRGVTGYQAGPKAAFGIVKDRLVIVNGGRTGKLVVDRALDGLGDAKPLSGSADWKARKAAARPGALAWGFARMDRLREIDPKRYTANGRRDAGEIILLGGWVEAIRKAPLIGASLSWTDKAMGAEVSLATPADGREPGFKAFVPPMGSGAPALIKTPGTIASVGLWRDLSAIWEARTDLLPPEAVQGLAQLDTFAGQFFGGRDFGTGVLGALDSGWRLVVATQDVKALDPVPDVKLPAFALVLSLKPGDDDFAQRLKVAFQSFIGLTNLGAAQTKAPPLELGSEKYEGVTIATARFMPPAPGAAPKPDDTEKPGPVNIRHNFTPSAVQVGDNFVISSSVALARDLVKTLQAPGKAQDSTLAAEVNGATLAQLVELNRGRLVMQNMLDRGHDKEQAEAEVSLLAALVRYLGQGRLDVKDAPDATVLGLEFQLGK